MTTETTKLKAKLAFLDSSLSALESSLSPLFAQSLPETTVGLTSIEQAKLQTLLPYLVYDLVFIYLKSKGLDPKTHPVVGELSRVRRYFDKISSAENPETPRAPLDKAAATRFIKHAITQSTFNAPSDEPQPAEPSTFVPARITSKMAERAAYEAELRERGDVSSEEEELEVIDGEEDAKAKGKGKVKEVVGQESEPVVATGSKRRRPAIDPFGLATTNPLRLNQMR
ncbi:Sas10/Utp3/C1D family-domain-containing protein [Mycena alexandri]|uniref:Exosome complex protein n=1 Tax=Mycena alexandri TaxID=1745969 RepID=A0AAD6TJG6_9AGAR|nr:Sas10/Utp3/C1D family-domain-containing protein [Mycena alexandri]